MTAGSTVVVVDGLRVEVSATGDDIVAGVGFTIASGEVLGLVGESGSGKTTVGLALLAHTRRGARIVAGRVQVGDHDMLALSRRERTRARGLIVAYIPQDPATALNPARRIGAHLLEALEVHDYGGSDSARRLRLSEMLSEVSLPEDAKFLRRYPHELSGGQQQRVAIAMAIACKPSVLVLDEPTTGLDVTTQAHVLKTVRSVAQSEGLAALYVSHDLSVVQGFADRVAVMYAGRLVEHGSARQVFRTPEHPYTRLLLAAVPHLDATTSLVAIPGRAPSPGSRPPGCPFEPRCALRLAECSLSFPEATTTADGHEVRCFQAGRTAELAISARTLDSAHGGPRSHPVLETVHLDASYSNHRVVHDVSFAVGEHECLALVGESGSGKTTIARSIAGIHTRWTGEIRLNGGPLATSATRRSRSSKREIQYIFQNPYGSLNPRRTVGQAVARPLALLDVPSRSTRTRVAEMLDMVALPASYAGKYPDELSGGERQRVAIARALICEPRVLLCDEVTSALDVSVQAAIVNLLHDLQRDFGLSILFVTHNLPLVRAIAQRVIVLRQGRIVESGDVVGVLASPSDEYTQRLLADAPRLAAAHEG